jgi:hypothetical protein
MNLKHYLMLGLAIIASFTACKHDPADIGEPIIDPPYNDNETFPVGNPTGPLTSFTVTSAGGELSSLDRTLTLRIPAGAVDKPTKISIQTVESTCPGGIGKSVRLLPHDIQFAKPVTIQFSYAALKDSINLASALSLAYQNEKGVWSLALKRVVDEATQTVNVATTHFSDWTIASAVRMVPHIASLSEKQERTFRLMHYTKINSYEEFADLISLDDDLAPLVQPNVRVIYEGRPLDSNYSKLAKWEINSLETNAEIGDIYPDANPASARYTSPSFIPHPIDLGVSAAFNTQRGKVIFVANVTLTPKNALVYRIGGGSWKTIQDVFVRKVKGEFLIGGYDPATQVGIHFVWTGNTGTYQWIERDKNPVGFALSDIVNNDHYQSGYTTAEGRFNSGGSLVITKVGTINDVISGKFIVQPTGLAKIGEPKPLIGPVVDGYFTLTRLPDSN